MRRRWAAPGNNAPGDPGGAAPELPSSLDRLGLDSPLFESCQEVWGRGEPLSPILPAPEAEEGRQQRRVSSCQVPAHGRAPGLPRGPAGAQAGVWGPRAECAGRHGGTGPAQQSGHAAAVRAALSGWGLASDRGEEGAAVLAARAAQPLALSGDWAHPQVQARQRLQMVSAPREREGARSPWALFPMAFACSPRASLPAARPFLTRILTLFVLAGSFQGARDACASLGHTAVPQGSSCPRATQERLSLCPVSPSPRFGNLEDVKKKKGKACLLCRRCSRAGESWGRGDVHEPSFLNSGCVGVHSLLSACRWGDAFR